MHQNQNPNPILKKVCRYSGPMLVGFTAALTIAVTTAPKADALYILSGVEDSAIVLDDSIDVPKISSEFVNVNPSKNGYSITLKKDLPISVSYQGDTISTTSNQESVHQLLRRLKITPGPLDMVAVNVSETQASIAVGSDLTLYDQVTEPATYETIRRPNSQMKEGEEKVVQEGKDGVRTSIYEVTWSNGREISRQFVEELESTAQNKIIEYGTYVEPVAPPPAPAASSNKTGSNENIHSSIVKVEKNADGSGKLILSTGEVLPFSGVKSMKATAYTAGHDGVGTRTATGTHVRRGTVAVDRRVVPLGTRMYIVTADGSYVYGLGVAEDTGYVGNNLDLYHDTYQQCIQFGRRGVTVYFLK